MVWSTVPFVIVVVLWVLLAISVGYHASGHDLSGIFWALIVLITGIYGAIAYLLVLTSVNSTVVLSGSEDTTRPATRPRMGTPSEIDLFVAIDEQLRTHGVVTKRGLQNTIYPDYSVGYDTPDEWWNGLVRPEFERRGVVDSVEGLENGWKLASD